MATEIYPCYVRVGESIGCEELVEIPSEKDGTMLLSTLTAQFPDAIGLRFKAASGGWRGVACKGNIMDPPPEGWGDGDYLIVKQGMKRRFESSEDETLAEKLSKMTEEEILSDLITLGLPYSASELDVKAHFEQFGELEMCEIKYDSSRKSRGFGFIRYKHVKAVEKALQATHVIDNRTVELRFPKDHLKRDDVPTKLFIGRLPRGSTVEDLYEHFSQYGVLKDAYVPEPFRGFGFVTFASQSDAREVMESTHVIKGTFVNVSTPSPKNDSSGQQDNQDKGFGYMQGRNMQSNDMQGNNMQRNDMQGNNMQRNDMQGNNMQRNGMLGNNMQRNGMQGNNMQPNGMQGNNMQRNGMQGNSMQRNGMQGNNMQRNGMQGNNMQRNGMQGENLLGNRMQGNKMQGNMPQSGAGYGYATPANNAGYTTPGYNKQFSGKTSTGNYRWGNA